MENFEKLKAELAELENDATKFFANGNSAAGTRLRVGMQRIKALAQEVRVAVGEAKKTK